MPHDFHQQGAGDALRVFGLEKHARAFQSLFRGVAKPGTALVPQVAEAAAEKAPLLERALGKKPLRKLMAGGLALGGGLEAGRSLMTPPEIQVQSSLPLRTMFP